MSVGQLPLVESESRVGTCTSECVPAFSRMPWACSLKQGLVVVVVYTRTKRVGRQLSGHALPRISNVAMES